MKRKSKPKGARPPVPSPMTKLKTPAQYLVEALGEEKAREHLRKLEEEEAEHQQDPVNNSIWIIRKEDGVYGSDFYSSEEEAERVMRSIESIGYYYFFVEELTKYDPNGGEE